MMMMMRSLIKQDDINMSKCDEDRNDDDDHDEGGEKKGAKYEAECRISIE